MRATLATARALLRLIGSQSEDWALHMASLEMEVTVDFLIWAVHTAACLTVRTTAFERQPTAFPGQHKGRTASASAAAAGAETGTTSRPGPSTSAAPADVASKAVNGHAADVSGAGEAATVEASNGKSPAAGPAESPPGTVSQKPQSATNPGQSNYASPDPVGSVGHLLATAAIAKVVAASAPARPSTAPPAVGPAQLKSPFLPPRPAAPGSPAPGRTSALQVWMCFLTCSVLACLPPHFLVWGRNVGFLP